MIEMAIHGVAVSQVNYQRVVVLKEKDADCYLPIWIGPAEANAIAVRLERVAVPRPLTHDLLAAVIGALEARVKSVIISELKDEIFYAKIILEAKSKQTEVDSRPSDALALAVRAEVPIFADEAVLEKAGLALDKETGIPVPPGQGPEKRGKKQVTEDELRRMSAFTDFIKTLDMDDIDQGRRDK